ncbi:MAG: hypothetical protein ABI550_10000 [Ignavibacteriaceae bacterium]|jgi:hypothetical protein
MSKSIVIGGCVKIPDGRVGRVREKVKNQYKVRVRRKTSVSHQFLLFDGHELKPVDCPKGWMSIEGYNRYLKKTLAKMKERESKH